MSNNPTHPQKKKKKHVAGSDFGSYLNLDSQIGPRTRLRDTEREREKTPQIYRCTFSPKHRPEPSDSSHSLPPIATQASHPIRRSHVWQESTGATLSGGERSALPSLAKSSGVIFLRFPRSARPPPLPTLPVDFTDQQSKTLPSAASCHPYLIKKKKHLGLL